MPPTSKADDVDRIRHHLDQARRDGRRPPGRPALIEATGLTEHAVRTALDKIKEGGHTNHAPDTTAGTRRRQTAGEPPSPGADHQGASSPGDLQPATNRAPTPATSRPYPATSRRTGLAAGRRSDAPAGRTSVESPPSTSIISTEAPSGGMAVSWLGFAFGSITSIAANVLHTWLPASTQPPGWTPGLGPQIGAGVWPVALIVTVEVLTRVRWRRTWSLNAVRYGIGTIVAVGSFAISYGHIHAVLTAWHYDPISASIGPLVLDGLMTISGFALLTSKLEHTEEGGARFRT